MTSEDYRLVQEVLATAWAGEEVDPSRVTAAMEALERTVRPETRRDEPRVLPLPDLGPRDPRRPRPIEMPMSRAYYLAGDDQDEKPIGEQKTDVAEEVQPMAELERRLREAYGLLAYMLECADQRVWPTRRLDEVRRVVQEGERWQARLGGGAP